MLFQQLFNSKKKERRIEKNEIFYIYYYFNIKSKKYAISLNRKWEKQQQVAPQYTFYSGGYIFYVLSVNGI